MGSDQPPSPRGWRRSAYVRYLCEFRGLRWPLFWGNVCAIIQALSLIPISLFFRNIIDDYIPNQNAAAILPVIAAGALLWAVHVAATILSRYYTLRATKRVTENLRARLLAKLQQLTLRVHDNERAATLHARVVMDTERVDVMANALVVVVLTSLVISVSVAGLLAWMNPRLFVLLLLPVPLYFVLQRVYAERLKQGHRDFRERMEEMSATINEILHSIRLVKSFARESHEQQRAEARMASVTERGVEVFTKAAAFQSLLTAVGGLASLMVFTVGGWMVMNGHVTLGEIVAFSALVAYFLNPVNTLIASTDVILAGHASLQSVYQLLDVHGTEESEHLPQHELGGRVTFENVSFGYDPAHPVLQNIDLDVEPGARIALVGSSGAGKTTLINLILGFYRPTEGRVLLDGHDAAAMNLRRLREQVGIVSQDTILLSGTVLDNIRYARPDATMEQIEAAARLANAHDFIAALPEGYETPVGDRGVRLSGGQRQRLAIARAVLKDPRILILDEATSALDSESERLVQQAFEQLRAGRTTFIIAHRLSTVREADRILVLRGGRIVEQGRYEELLACRGEFHRYHALQFAPGPSGEVA